MNASKLCRRLSLLAPSVALALLANVALAQSSKVDRLVTFGGSLSDTGNAFAFLSDPAIPRSDCGVPQGVPPYDTLDDFLVPDGPYAKGGHHFSNGATWVEGVARALALAGNARPALTNAGKAASNYAAGGARAVAHDDWVAACRYNLPAQIGAYLADFPQTSARSLIAMEIGGNDVRDALLAALERRDPAPILQSALASVANSVGALYASGARKFVLLNIPDPGVAPSVRMFGPDAVAGARVLATGYNDFMLYQLVPAVEGRAAGQRYQDRRSLRLAEPDRREPGFLRPRQRDRRLRHAGHAAVPVPQARQLPLLGRPASDEGGARDHRAGSAGDDVRALMLVT